MLSESKKSTAPRLHFFLYICFAGPLQRRKKEKNPNIVEIQINASRQSHALLRLLLHVFITINIERPLSIILSNKLLFLLYEKCHTLKERSIILSRFKSISIFAPSRGKSTTIFCHFVEGKNRTERFPHFTTATCKYCNDVQQTALSHCKSPRPGCVGFLYCISISVELVSLYWTSRSLCLFSF